jgi:hypothetical protein
MPAPTTKPKPSPKSPPVCAKGPDKTPGPPQLPQDRILTAMIENRIAGTGLPQAFIGTFPLYATANPYEWTGFRNLENYSIYVTVNKNPDDDAYSIEVAFETAGAPFFTQEWENQTPRTVDPIEFAEVTYKDPSTATIATLTILS